MSYQVLARKWRPRSFTDVAGQSHVVRALSNALDQGRLHHAWLLTGTRGVGKTTLARILAKALNCQTGVTSAPCGTCAACQEIDAGRFVDLLELDAASNTGIDNMREVLDNAQYAPTVGRYKVYLIDEVHMLSRAAFNSMLKTLEEPPPHVKFILATTDPQKIPVTVLSRCLQFNLKHLPPAEVFERLSYILGEEQIAFEPAAIQLVSRAAQGSMRDALSLLDQAIAYGEGKVEEQLVRDMLGAIDQGFLFSLLEALAAQDGATLMRCADEMETRSIAFEAALQDLAALLHKIAIVQKVPAALPADTPELPRIEALAQTFSAEAIQLYYQIALQGRRDISLAPDEYAGFTMTLLRMLAFRVEAFGDAAPAASPARSPVSRPAVPPPASPVRAEPASTPSPAPAPASAPASEPRAVASPAARGVFDGNWAGFVEKLGGMAKMLGQHCEVVSHSGHAITLCVAEAWRHLLEKSYQDRLRAALAEHYGEGLRVEIVLGQGAGMTPLEVQERDRQQRRDVAIASIEADPYIATLRENFDATVIEASIQPIQTRQEQ